ETGDVKLLEYHAVDDCGHVVNPMIVAGEGPGGGAHGGGAGLLEAGVVDDCGHVVNPMIVAGQVHGGIAQGIGQAMFEDAIYDDEGNMLTGSLLDYPLPTATDLPALDLHRTVTPSPLTP